MSRFQKKNENGTIGTGGEMTCIKNTDTDNLVLGKLQKVTSDEVDTFQGERYIGKEPT